jgi:hypothetical protein
MNNSSCHLCSSINETRFHAGTIFGSSGGLTQSTDEQYEPIARETRERLMGDEY